MRIERIEVEEGFLSGLDVTLTAGLNVLIGERGTGKTSIIELLRFCLGASSFTAEAQSRGHQQALSVLGDGVVRVTVFDGTERVVLSRSAADGEPRRSFAPWTTVLAQNEIEAIGAQPTGRLRLLDRFRTDLEPDRLSPSLIASLKAMTSEIQTLVRELDQIAERTAELASVEVELVEAKQQQAAVLSSVEATEDQRAELRRLQEMHSLLSGRETALASARDQLSYYRDLLRPLADSGLEIDPWPDTGSKNGLEDVRTQLRSAAAALRTVESTLATAQSQIDRSLSTQEAARRAAEERARSLRVALNRLREGVGAITKRVDELQERKGQLDALIELREARLARLAQLTHARAAKYDELDALRQARFESRQRVAQRLNELLGPAIRVDVTRSAAVGGYVQALINALRGSGIHYNTLAPQLARDLSPLELVAAAETLDIRLLSSSSDISTERAAAVLRFLRGSGTGDLIAAPIDDSITLELLDGTDYKTTESLSIGQRCTVVLPILLASHDSVLLVDQPEDHLDNAFVTSTLVETLRSRDPEDQLLFSSHNPNIPVLGEADQVIVLGSNGKRGFKLHQGRLDDPSVVNYVTALMEGGAEAFRRRAEFYGRTSVQ